jgi:transposase
VSRITGVWPTDPDAFRDHKPVVCGRCGGAFAADADMTLIGEYDEIEIPPVKPFVVRHRRFACRCAACGVAAKAPAPAIATTTPFWPRIHARAIDLKGFHAIPTSGCAGCCAMLSALPSAKAR